MAFDSCRDFVNQLDQAGELKRITQPALNSSLPRWRCSFAVQPGAVTFARNEAPRETGSFAGLQPSG